MKTLWMCIVRSGMISSVSLLIRKAENLEQLTLPDCFRFVKQCLPSKDSPDGRYILFCKSGHGNLTIWQPESDLYLLDLKTGIVSKPDINSNKSESFHTWSSTGRWIVFSSRRDDGLLYTRPYLPISIHQDRCINHLCCLRKALSTILI